MNEIVVAIIGAVAIIIVALIETLRRQNRAEHAENGAKLDGISFMLGKVDQKIDDHINDHKERRR